MSLQAILLPLFVLVTLTFVLGFWAASMRISAVRSGAVSPRDIALREPNWPPRVARVAYAYENQLELPLLFYVLTVLALLTRHADLIFVVMAWVFVVLRLMHAYVHVTTNHLGHRATSFLGSATVLALMWAIFIVRILLGLA